MRNDSLDHGGRTRPRGDVCRVCGLCDGEEFWSAAGPEYVICAYCGAESGVDDLTPRMVRRYRRQWLDSGAEPCATGEFERLSDGDLRTQLENAAWCD